MYRVALRSLPKPSLPLTLGILVISSIFFLFTSLKPCPAQNVCYPDTVQSHSHQASAVDIDIGTNGSPIEAEAAKLISFDPFDELMISDKYERYPYIVADFSGPADFYINDALRGCSTLNKRNERYDSSYREETMKNNCPPDSELNVGQKLEQAMRDFNSSFLKECMHAPLRKVQVEAVTLSSFLPKINVSHINYLKIDAQGSDFSILKDLFEHAPHILVNKILVECQVYDQSIPLYFTSNDCNEIVTYVSRKFPSARFDWTYNNCLLKEYNIEITNLH